MNIHIKTDSLADLLFNRGGYEWYGECGYSSVPQFLSGDAEEYTAFQILEGVPHSGASAYPYQDKNGSYSVPGNLEQIQHTLRYAVSGSVVVATDYHGCHPEWWRKWIKTDQGWFLVCDEEY